MDLLLPNLVRSDQKIDPIEGFLPYYISSIGQNLYTCLIPDIRGDDPIMDKFRRYIVTTVDALDNDGPDEDTSIATTTLYGGYRRFIDGLVSVLKLAVYDAPKTKLGVRLMFFQCDRPDNNINEFFVFSSMPTTNIDTVFLVVVTLLRRFIYCHPWTIIPFWA